MFVCVCGLGDQQQRRNGEQGKRSDWPSIVSFFLHVRSSLHRPCSSPSHLTATTRGAGMNVTYCIEGQRRQRPEQSKASFSTLPPLIESTFVPFCPQCVVFSDRLSFLTRPCGCVLVRLTACSGLFFGVSSPASVLSFPSCVGGFYAGSARQKGLCDMMDFSRR